MIEDNLISEISEYAVTISIMDNLRKSKADNISTHFFLIDIITNLMFWWEFQIVLEPH